MLKLAAKALNFIIRHLDLVDLGKAEKIIVMLEHALNEYLEHRKSEEKITDNEH